MNSFAGKKFLVVDDDEMLRELISDIFKGENAEVSEASNGKLAFSMIQNSKFDVVFSDVRMPGGDGIELAKNVFEMSAPKPLMFICSGFNDLTDKQAKDLGILKVFEKPFDHHELITEILRWLVKLGEKFEAK